jgi:hypothetical protein
MQKMTDFKEIAEKLLKAAEMSDPYDARRLAGLHSMCDSETIQKLAKGYLEVSEKNNDYLAQILGLSRRSDEFEAQLDEAREVIEFLNSIAITHAMQTYSKSASKAVNEAEAYLEKYHNHGDSNE